MDFSPAAPWMAASGAFETLPPTTTSNTRKRPRSTSPTPPRGRAKAKVPDGAVLASQLEDPEQRVSALNQLLVASSSHEANYALGAHGERILAALVSIVHDCHDWEGGPETETEESTGSSNDDKVAVSDQPRFVASSAWLKPPSKDSLKWARHCERRLALKGSLHDDSTLEVILVIFRNLSFVAANLRLMAYSPDVVAVLVGCLYDSGSSGEVSDDGSASSRGNLSLYALQTLVHLAPHLDVTGQTLYCDRTFLDPTKLDEQGIVPNPEKYGQARIGTGWGGLHLAKRLDNKEDVVVDVDPNDILQETGEVLVGVWSVFSALAKVIVDPQSPRNVIMAAVDLLKEFLDQASNSRHGEAGVPNAREIMCHIPDAVLDRLVDLLWIPRLGPDSMEYVNPVNNIVARVSTLKLLMGYDATVDTDLRDRSLDVLVPLLDLKSSDPDLPKRLGFCKGKIRTRLYDALVPVLSTMVGRNDAPNLASELLGQLARAEENRVGLAYVQERLLHLASRGDVRVASLACNHLYNNDKKKKKD